MNKTVEMIVLANSAVEEAERCRLEALETIAKDPKRYADLSGEPSGWCVVTQKGFWSRKYHDRFEEPRLRDCIEGGHKVILTVGLVAKPGSSLSVNNYVASVAVREPRKISADKMAGIILRAKIHATHALNN
jgi:hypothetical protein